ncbi:MAG: CDP-glycerol glycerophosphotransferase family protein [Lachnospiraceae bacterium]
MDKNKIFASICNFYGKLCRTKNSRVTLIEKHNTGFTGNLHDLYLEISKRYPDTRFNIIYHNDYSSKSILSLLKLFTVKAFRMMSSKYIFLNDNFMPMAYINFHNDCKIVQVWHGIGAFKTFGIPTLSDSELIAEVKKANESVSMITVSTDNAIPIYAEAFGVPKEKVKATGIPQADFYLKEHNVKELKEKFYKEHPTCKGKKLVLYAPTFRDNPEADSKLLDNFDFETFTNELSDEYVLLVRLHPQIHSDSHFPENVINVTDYPSVRNLLLISDIMIADYSSITIEFALLGRPIIMYPFDFERYTAQDRGFYFDYFKQAPGPVCYTTNEIIDCIKNNDFSPEKIQTYAQLHNSFWDCKSAERIIDYTMGKN